MGYELDRLMRQYGVSTPTVAGYSGSVAPGAPPAADASQEDKDAFLASVTRYGVDKKAYDTYTKEYADRIAAGSMYNQPQYNTSSTPSLTYRYGQPLPTPRPATPTPASQDPIKAPTNALFSADMVGWTEAQKQDYYNRLRAQGYTTPELRASVQKVLGTASPNDEGWKYLEDKYKVASAPKPVVTPPVVVPPVVTSPVVTPPVLKAKPTTDPVYTADMVNLTPAQKIAYYNSQRDAGYTVPQLRASVENVLGAASPNDEGWKWLEDKYNAPAPVAAAPVAAAPVAAAAVVPAPVVVPPVTQAPQLYTGLTSGSNAQDIANAYSQYVGGMGGNTVANQTTAMNYLTNLGLSNDAIQAAYQKYLNPQPSLPPASYANFSQDINGNELARGGSIRDLVAKYADGGPVRRRFQDGGVNNLNRGPNYGYGLDVPMPALDAPDPLRSINNTAPIDPNKALASAVQSRYSQDITNMMNKRDLAEKEMMDNFKAQSEEKMTSAPSKAETYFRLASAFAEPGQTGSFGEGLGRAAGVMGDYQQAVRESDTANSLAKRAMQNELLKYSASSAQSKLDSMIDLENKMAPTNAQKEFEYYNSLTDDQKRIYDEYKRVGDPTGSLERNFNFFNNLDEVDQQTLRDMTTSTSATAITKEDEALAQTLASGQPLSELEQQNLDFLTINYGNTMTLPFRRGNGGPNDPNMKVLANAAEMAKTAGLTPQEWMAIAPQRKADTASLVNLQKNYDALSGVLESFHNNLQTWNELATNAEVSLGGDQVKRIAREMATIDYTGIASIDDIILRTKAQFNDPRAKAIAAAAMETAMDYARIMQGPQSNASLTEGAREEAMRIVNASANAEGRAGLTVGLLAGADGQLEGKLFAINNVQDRIAGREEGTTNQKRKTDSAASTPPASRPPVVGEVRDGYKFKGGDPSLEANWEKL